MAQYMVSFTPLEPYFFGGEKTFSFTNEGRNYFIFSEPLPQQTTLLGTLRYFFLPEKRFSKVKDYAHIVGGESFDITKQEAQSFGVIRRLSPLFLVRGEEIFVRTPMDHQVAYGTYTPFARYRRMQTTQGEKMYTEDMDAKQGIADGFMSLADRSVFSLKDFVRKQKMTRTHKNEQGISRVYHRESYRLHKDFSFAVFAELDIEQTPEDSIVYMGQCKSAFRLHFHPAGKRWEETEEKISSMLSSDMVYFFGDAPAFHDIYEKCLFSVTQLRSYRSFYTKGETIQKGECQYHLLRNGCMLKCNEEEYHLIKKRFDIENYKNIGWNHIIRGKQ